MSDDPRTGTLFNEYSYDNLNENSIVIIGFPFDEGVRRNGGRIGAAKGPSTVREFIKKIGTVINPEFGIDCNKLQLYDAGDVGDNIDNEQLEIAHQLLEDKVLSIIKKQSIPFVIGGGNDQSFSNALGLLKNTLKPKSVTVINIDAHLDVRPLKENKVHSGSPFYMLLNSNEWKEKGAGFIEFAAQGSQCSAIHAKYVKDNNGSICWLSTIRKHLVSNDKLLNLPFNSKSTIELLQQEIESFESTESIFISFDIDSIQGSDCPGVSCPATVGLTANEALDICFWAGCNPKVKLFDLSEYNPKIESYRTGRLIANMFYYFILGRNLLYNQ